MWVLLLNDMRHAHIEQLTPVARAETKEQLIAFLQRETVEPYQDDHWSKTFKKGGPLEWFNPPWSNEPEHYQDVQSEDEWAEAARRRYRNTILCIPKVGE